jgi:hypothetical protein
MASSQVVQSKIQALPEVQGLFQVDSAIEVQIVGWPVFGSRDRGFEKVVIDNKSTRWLLLFDHIRMQGTD